MRAGRLAQQVATRGLAVFEGDQAATLIFRERTSRPPLSPEKRLILAVVEDAIEAYRKNRALRHYNARRIAEDERVWFIAESRESFGFGWCCEALNLDPEAVRSAVLGSSTPQEVTCG